jgi:excisionase family DNA binding protein
MPAEELLELAEAAGLLGVHPSTLRRWADSGKIPHVRMMSGRRRFARAELLRAREAMQPATAPLKPAQFEIQTRALARQRGSALSDPQAGWMAHLNEDQRLLFRYSGQRLLGLMVQFISRSGSAETFLEEGRRATGDYSRICYQAGLSISETTEAFLYFRRSVLESVQATAGLGGPDDQDGRRIFLRTIDFFDALLVATIENYDRITHSEPE